MLLEVPKENVSNSDEWLRRKRRIQFYSRLGVKVLKGVNYLLPIKIDGNVEEMYLMIKLSKNITRISKKSIINFIDSVYTDVYDYRKNDLLNKTSAKLPAIYGIPCDSSNPSSPLFQVLVGRAPDIIPTRLGYIEQVSAPPDMCVYHAQFGFGDPVTDVI
jgi:hypothetical protein